jgi:hypothetical protein
MLATATDVSLALATLGATTQIGWIISIYAKEVNFTEPFPSVRIPWSPSLTKKIIIWFNFRSVEEKNHLIKELQSEVRTLKETVRYQC